MELMRCSDRITWCVRIIIVLATMIASASCRAPLEPHGTIPDGSVRIDMPAEYAAWWAEVEQCSGLKHNDVHTITFYIVPTSSFTYGTDGVEYGGYYERVGNIVLLAWDLSLIPSAVEHEFLHAQLEPVGGHPAKYFKQLCGSVVAQTDRP